MPRSSGGGSHSSGSHHSSGSSHSYSSGGGSHSSGSSYSSSRSYSSSSYSSSSYSSSGYSGSRSYSSGSYSRPRSTYTPPRVSREYFNGAKTYVRYVNSTPHYLYANVSPNSYEGGIGASLLRGVLKIAGWLNVAMLVLLVGAIIFSFVGGYGPLNASYDKSIVIVDNAGVMGSTAELEASMNSFLEITGVAPAVITVHNEDWEPYYTALENYVFDLYVNTFDDECHWLWVYSEPAEPDPDFNNWSFEGMQGDSTTSVITSVIADKMVDALQIGFTKSSVYVEQAFADGFDEVSDYAENLFDNSFDPLYVLVVIPFAILAAVPFIILKVFNSFISKKYASYVPAGSSVEKKAKQNAEAEAALKAPKKKQRNCEYCGSLYFVGVDKVCPGCGAPVSAEQ